MSRAGLRCSFCGLTKTGGVAGPTPATYICVDCIDLTYELVHGSLVSSGEPGNGQDE